MSSIILSFSVSLFKRPQQRRQLVRESDYLLQVQEKVFQRKQVKTDPGKVIENLIGHVNNFNNLNLMT